MSLVSSELRVTNGGSISEFGLIDLLGSGAVNGCLITMPAIGQSIPDEKGYLARVETWLKPVDVRPLIGFFAVENGLALSGVGIFRHVEIQWVSRDLLCVPDPAAMGDSGYQTRHAKAASESLRAAMSKP